MTTLFGVLGGILTGSAATRSLAGSAGITSRIRSNINESVFYNNFATAIISQIDAQRKQKMFDIAPKRSSGVKIIPLMPHCGILPNTTICAL